MSTPKSSPDSLAGAPQEPPYQWWRRHDDYEEENT